MKTETILLTLSLITIASLLFAIIYTAGVVWRVEKELDISYKFLLVAVIFILAAEALNLYYPLENTATIAIIIKGLRLGFALSFLIGVLFMRDLIRRADGEIEK